jgi:hypothetical protein
MRLFKRPELNPKGHAYRFTTPLIVLVCLVAIGVNVLISNRPKLLTGSQTATGTCYTQTYQTGSQGPCVSDIQVMVNWYNANVTPSHAAVSVTGTFAAKTKSAVTFFKKHANTGYSFGKKATSVVDAATWNAFCKPLKPVGVPPAGFLSAMQDACGTTVPYTTPTPAGPLLGALDPTASYASLYASGLREVVVSANWNAIEPTEGSFSATAVAAVQAQLNAATAAGLSPSLDIGIQYAPAWIFTVGGGTQFVDQYGDVFGGTLASGNSVANAVTDPNVRAQLGTYIAYLGTHLTGVDSVRLGGAAYNELRYPSGHSGSQANAYWFYDSSSQASLPANVQGWKPGAGTVAQATAFIDAYNNALSNYGVWLVQQGAADFSSSTKLELLLPGWGERTGEVTTAVNKLLLATPDEVNQGLDWAGMLPWLPSASRVVAYSTYADATIGSATNPNPAAYIHSLLPTGMLAGGESTGNGNTTAAGMNLMFQDAKQWNWYVVNWFFHGQPQTPDQLYQAFNAN